MLEAPELLQAAEELGSLAPVTAAKLSRAVSTTCDAVLHTVLRSAGDLLVGDEARSTGAYTTVCRDFSHRRIAEICRGIQTANLKRDVGRALGGQAVSAEAKLFAWSLGELQVQRHVADYDPDDQPTVAATAEGLLLARFAVDVWTSIPSEERRDILALMLVAPHR